MAIRLRKDSAPGFAPLTIYDFLPLFRFRRRDGSSGWWLNWPVVVAIAAGFLAGRHFGV